MLRLPRLTSLINLISLHQLRFIKHSAPILARTMTSHAGKTYAEAITALNTLQSNAATIAAIRASGTTGGSLAPELEYLDRLGYKVRLVLTLT